MTALGSFKCRACGGKFSRLAMAMVVTAGGRVLSGDCCYRNEVGGGGEFIAPAPGWIRNGKTEQLLLFEREATGRR
jgi:hypothetical protein